MSARRQGITNAGARQALRTQMDEFLTHLAVLGLRGRPVWLLTCPSLGWVAHEYKLATLCRTITNLFAVRIPNLSQVTVISWPQQFADGECFDLESDRTSQARLAQQFFQPLATDIARQVKDSVTAGDTNATIAASGSSELVAFLAGLHVKVKVFPAMSDDHEHVARILRTAASFSLIGENPTLPAEEVDAILRTGNCYLISVADRIADYGPSGVLVTRLAHRSEALPENRLSAERTLKRTAS